MGEPIFPDREIKGFTSERVLVLAASYTGDESISTDFDNLMAVLDKLFNPYWFDLPTTTADELTYEIQDYWENADWVTTYGMTIDARIPFYVQRQTGGAGAFVKVDESEYTINRTLGTITFAEEQGESDVIVVSLCANIPVTSFEGSGSISLTTNKVFIAGTEKEAYRWTRDEGADPTFSLDAVVDVGEKHNLYPGEQVLKLIYGDDWTLAAAAEEGDALSEMGSLNELIKNESPFFVAYFHITTDTDAEDLKLIGEIYQGCELDELPTRKNVVDRDNPSIWTIKGKASAVYHKAVLNPAAGTGP